MAKTTKPASAIVAELFPKSEKALSETLSTEQFNAFTEDAQEIQDRIDAQTQGNQAVADDLKGVNATLTETQTKLTASETALEKANTDLTQANTDLTAANKLNGELKAKADQWDAYKASLKGAGMGNDTGQGGKGAPSSLSEKDQTALDEKQRLAKLYPNSMAALGITATEE